MAGVDLDAHHLAIGSGGQRRTQAGGGLGQQRRDAAVEDPVGLVDLPGQRQAEDDPGRLGFEHLDVEELVNVVTTTRERPTIIRCGGSRGHGGMLPVPPLG